MKRRMTSVLLLIFAACVSSPACPSCYGAADSPMTAGMNMAIIGMLGLTGFVLAAISFIFFILIRRAKILRDHSVGNTYITEKGDIRWNNF